MSRRGRLDRSALLLLVLGASACARPAASAGDATTNGTTTALAVDSALVAMAGRPLWPGFAPLTAPVAIFDGSRTWLFRHPSPPAGYVVVEGRPDVATRVGRDSTITANTSALLGGVATATVMLDPRLPAPAAAALTIHELFHVFQRARHPSWQANEADLFAYPVENAMALALRRQETSALSAVPAATSPDSQRCLARTFLGARAQRFALVGAAAAAYERGTELNEGLAQYVERRAAGRAVTLSAIDAPAAHVRQRAYDVGAALAGTLDFLRPDWQRTLEEPRNGATIPLDSLLREAMSGAAPQSPCASPTPAESASWLTMADIDVRALVAERDQKRAEFLGRPGWRLVIDARGTPLFPAGFDPLNVARLSATEILHTRFLKLQNASGAIELLGGAALTEGSAGQHPLFAGVSRVTFAGLSRPPSMRDSADVLIVDAPGVSARFRHARANVAGQMVTLAWR